MWISCLPKVQQYGANKIYTIKFVVIVSSYPAYPDLNICQAVWGGKLQPPGIRIENLELGSCQKVLLVSKKEFECFKEITNEPSHGSNKH